MKIALGNIDKKCACFKANGKKVKEGQWENVVVIGDDGGDKINEHDLRDPCKLNFIQEDNMNESQLNGVIILDSKWCRMVEEIGVKKDKMDGLITNSHMLGQANSKNLDIASTGSQACQVL